MNIVITLLFCCETVRQCDRELVREDRIIMLTKNFVLAGFGISFLFVMGFNNFSQAWASDPVADIVELVSVDSYTHYLYDRLYTHDGDDRKYGPEHNLARDNIFEDFSDMGLDVALDPFEYGVNTYYNVVAVHEGKVRPEEIYIIGGHFDSVGNPGADDDASGVAASLEAARVLSQLDFEATLIFIAFDREEQWMIGSYAYANKHKDDDIRGMISTDMIAYNPGGRNIASISGNTNSDSLKNALAEVFHQYVPVISTDVTSGIFSDHVPFEDMGVPSCILIEFEYWNNSNYHQASDSVDNPGYIDYEFATKLTKASVAYLATVAGLLDPVLSRPVPGLAGEVNTLKASNATPDMKTYFVYGLNSGATEIPMCPGVYVMISQPNIATFGIADSQGDVVVEQKVPGYARGRMVNIQAVEVGSCRTSNLVKFVFE